MVPGEPVLFKRCEKGAYDSKEVESYRDGDRVIICQNDRKRDCSNGDVGILHILRTDPKDVAFWVEMPDGRCPAWNNISDLDTIALA